MKPTSPSSATTWWAVLVFALGLFSIAAVLPGGDWTSGARAEEEGERPDEEDPDLGDKKLPFAEQVNKAIAEGTNWLMAKPALFDIPGARDDEKGAFWGRIKGSRLYGGGKGPGYPHPAGSTALALYTLLKCGVDAKHPLIKKGFNWIRVKHKITKKWDDIDGTGFTWDWTEAGSSYELSAMVLALTAKWDPHKKTAKSKGRAKKGKLRIKNADDREWLQRMVDELVSRRGHPVEDGDEKGWRYNVPKIVRTSGGRSKRTWTRGGTGVPPHANEDLSSTQLAALALYSAHRFGIKVDPQVWMDIATFTLAHQEKEGPKVERHVPGYKEGGYSVPIDYARGFCYIPGSNSGSEGRATGSMTACGVANLIMAREFLANHRKMRKKFLAGDLPKKIDTAINDGLAWLDYFWSPSSNMQSTYGYHIYYMYGVERCMDMRGTQLLGRRAWYPAMAKYLLKIQQRVKSVDVPQMRRGTKPMPGTFWKTGATHEPKDVLDTCFALLFLKRATWGMVPPPPVVTGD